MKISKHLTNTCWKHRTSDNKHCPTQPKWNHHATFHLSNLHGSNTNALSMAARLIDRRLKLLWRIDDETCICMNITPYTTVQLNWELRYQNQSQQQHNPCMRTTTHQSTLHMESTQYSYMGRYIGHNGAAEILVPHQQDSNNYQQYFPNLICQDTYGMIPSNSTMDKYFIDIEVWGTIAHINPFKITMDPEFYP